MGQPWRSLRVGGLEMDVPDRLAPTPERGIEGSAAVLEAAGIRLTVDASPFADPLTRYTNKPGYEHWQEVVGRDTADFVSFEEGGIRTVAVNFPGQATVVVHLSGDALSGGAERGTALQILRSIRRDQGESND